MAEILDGLAADLTALDVPPEREVSVTQLAESVDPLTISVVYDKDKDPSGGIIKIAWETTQFSAPFTVGK